MGISCFESRFGLVDTDTIARQYERGQTLYHNGDPISGTFCVMEGRVAVFTTGATGLSLPLYVAGSGELLGVPEILGHDRFQCTAVCVEKTTACFISKQRFLEHLKDRPDISIVLMRQLCRHIDQVERVL